MAVRYYYFMDMPGWQGNRIARSCLQSAPLSTRSVRSWAATTTRHGIYRLQFRAGRQREASRRQERRHAHMLLVAKNRVQEGQKWTKDDRYASQKNTWGGVGSSTGYKRQLKRSHWEFFVLFSVTLYNQILLSCMFETLLNSVDNSG